MLGSEIIGGTIKSPSDKFKSPSNKFKALSDKFKSSSTNSNLHSTSSKLHPTNSNLHQTNSNLHPTNSKLHPSNSNRGPTSNKFRAPSTNSKLLSNSPPTGSTTKTALLPWKWGFPFVLFFPFPTFLSFPFFRCFWVLRLVLHLERLQDLLGIFQKAKVQLLWTVLLIIFVFFFRNPVDGFQLDFSDGGFCWVSPTGLTQESRNWLKS